MKAPAKLVIILRYNELIWVENSFGG